LTWTLPIRYLEIKALLIADDLRPLRMRTNLTSLFVESAKAPERGQAEYWDTKVTGLGMRISQGGRKTWTLLYRHRGRLRRLSLGTFPVLKLADARELAKLKLADVQHGIDPAAVRQEERQGDSFAALADRYLSEYARIKKKPKSVSEDQKMIRGELLPAWGNRKADEIIRRDVLILVDGIAARGAFIQANRVLALISKIFNFATDKEILGASPAVKVPKPGQEHRRDRVLRDQEIKRLWGASTSDRST
jgi:hypothetical protein